MTPEEAYAEANRIIDDFFEDKIKVDDAKTQINAVLGHMVSRGNQLADKVEAANLSMALLTARIDEVKKHADKKIAGKDAWVKWMTDRTAWLLDKVDSIAYAATPCYRFMKLSMDVEEFLVEAKIRPGRPPEKK